MTTEQDNGVRFALIGCGAWGSHHARVIAGTVGARLVATAKHSEQNRGRNQGGFGVNTSG